MKSLTNLFFIFICVFTLTSCSANRDNFSSQGFDMSKENDDRLIKKHSSPSENPKEDTSSNQNKDLDSNEFEGEESLSGLDKEADTESPKVSDRTKYVLDPITEKRYEEKGSFIEFDDMPENDAETLVCYNLLYKITGNYHEKITEFLYSIPENDYEELAEATAESSYEWIKVFQINTMSFDELKESDDYVDLFQQLVYKLAPDMELDDYVEMILNNRCAVVYINYSDKYTEKKASELPQNADGDHKEYYLLVPDENNQLRIFDSTEYYVLFNIYDKDNVPNALKVN